MSEKLNTLTDAQMALLQETIDRVRGRRVNSPSKRGPDWDDTWSANTFIYKIPDDGIDAMADDVAGSADCDIYKIEIDDDSNYTIVQVGEQQAVLNISKTKIDKPGDDESPYGLTTQERFGAWIAIVGGSGSSKSLVLGRMHTSGINREESGTVELWEGPAGRETKQLDDDGNPILASAFNRTQNDLRAYDLSFTPKLWLFLSPAESGTSTGTGPDDPEYYIVSAQPPANIIDITLASNMESGSANAFVGNCYQGITIGSFLTVYDSNNIFYDAEFGAAGKAAYNDSDGSYDVIYLRGTSTGTGTGTGTASTDVTVVTGVQVSGNLIQIKTRSITVTKAGAESGWTTIHTGATC